MPIPNEPVGLNLGSAPPLMLLQHMDMLELRELVSKLSDNQASMMDFLQSLIEPHPDRNLDFSHVDKKEIPGVLKEVEECLSLISDLPPVL